MNHSFIIGKRVIKELVKDKKLFILSVVAPLILIYFLKLFMDGMPDNYPVARYVMPISAFIVHFLSFLLCSIILVQERTSGTLERMFVTGFKKISIIFGYIIGYFGLATLQAIIVLAETIWLMQLDYSLDVIALLFLTIWLLAIVSVMLGILISTFARHEGHIIPFIPLIILPTVFLSGLLIDLEDLPLWAEYLGMILPFHYANNIIQELITSTIDIDIIYTNFCYLIIFMIALFLIASKTLKDTQN